MKLSSVKFGVVALTATLALGTVSCRKGCTNPEAINYDVKAKKDDGTCITSDIVNPGGDNEIIKTGFISSNQTWTSDNIYVLDGKVVVENGATLTIEPGTIIKGEEGTGTLASALIIAKGAKIMAQGTPNNPIIFTSTLDNISVGQGSGTNLDQSDKGKWGGVLILGCAPISAADGDTQAQIEGIPVTDTYGAFGGDVPTDNSGVFSYVSIRHGGALIGAGNEINGLTLGGVGSGTTISNIEVLGNVDDGVEFFGGTVNASNIFVCHQGDDGIDIDMNYSGIVSNFIVINGTESDEGLEVDGPEGTTYTDGLFTLTNGVVYTDAGDFARGDFKSKAQGSINNVKLGEVRVRASYQNNCADPKEDAFTYLTDVQARLVFSGCEYTGVTIYTGSTDNSEETCPVQSADQTAAEGAMTSTSAVGADASAFAWTWASANGLL